MNTGRKLALSLLVAVIGVLPASGKDSAKIDEIRKWFESYNNALTSKDLDRLATFYETTVTIFEGGGVNNSWADYRDHHLGPELEELQDLRFTHSNVAPHVLGHDGQFAYVTSEYRLQGRIKDRDIDASGLETLILVKAEDGSWKIRHSHISSRR